MLNGWPPGVVCLQRTQWTRHGTPWDHILVLANAEVVFQDEKPSSTSVPAAGGVQAAAPPKELPPPPSVAQAAAAAAAVAAAQASAAARPPPMKQEEAAGQSAAAKAMGPPGENGTSAGVGNGGRSWLPSSMPLPSIPGMPFPPPMMAAAAAMGMPFGMGVPLPFMQGPGGSAAGEPPRGRRVDGVSPQSTYGTDTTDSLWHH